MTDIVGSTAQWELAPEAMHAALDEHDQAIAAIVESSGGRFLRHRGEGDSTFSTFDNPDLAVAAAAAILQRIRTAVWPGAVSINIRAAVYTGSVIDRDGEYFGATINRAARLRSKADRGQALVGGLTAELTRDLLPEAITLTRVGMLQLQDIPELEEAFLLIDASAVEADPLDQPAIPAEGRRRWAVLPVPLRSAATTFTGRSADLETLMTAFRSARKGRGGVVFIGGDPGIGKTRLTAEFARRALLDGAIVGFGRADPERGIPYRSFVDALTDLVAIAPEALLASYVQSFGGELTRIVPLLARRIADVPPPSSADPDTERHRLFDAVRGLLEHLAIDGPVVLLLDDLHDAGSEAVHLTRFLLDEAAKLPLLIVSTYRDGEVDRSSPLAKLFTHGQRLPHVTNHTLTGLDRTELSAMIHELLPVHSGRDDLALALVTETAGNPLFTIELLRTMASTGSAHIAAAIADTETVSEVIGRRVERLGPDATQLLTTAAVIGHTFDLNLVARVLTIDDGLALDFIEAAADAHLVVDGTEPGRFAFAHGLIPSVLVSTLNRTRRARLHLAVADVIDADGRSPGTVGSEGLARHLVAAGPLAEAQRVITAATAAADQALAQLAPEHAADWYRSAVDRSDPGSRQHIELSIALGAAERQAGLRQFRTTLLDASKAAVASKHHDLLLASVIANHRGLRSRTFFVDHERVEMLNEAIGGCEGDSADKARALAALAAELTHHPDAAARQAYSDEALAITRRLGDAAATCEVLGTRLDTELPPDASNRLDEIYELIRLSEERDDRRSLTYGLLALSQTRLQIGDIDGHDAAITRAHQARALVRDPFIDWRLASHDAYRAVLRGDLETAEHAARECYTVAKRGGQPDAESVLASHLLLIREAQGRLGELLDAQRRAVEIVPDSAALRTVFAFVLAATGDVEGANAELDRFVSDHDRVVITRDMMRLMALAYLGRAAARTGHIEVARLVYAEVEPSAEQVVWSGSCALGPAAQILAETALTLGDVDAARRHAGFALDLSRRMQCPIWSDQALDVEKLARQAMVTHD